MRRKKRFPKRVYSVWDAETDELIILDADAAACAARLGVSTKTFIVYVSRHNNGTDRRFVIESRLTREYEDKGALILEG